VITFCLQFRFQQSLPRKNEKAVSSSAGTPGLSSAAFGAKLGSLCMRPPGFQKQYEHELPIQKEITEPRINLTFRWIANWQKTGVGVIKTGSKMQTKPNYKPHDDAYKPPAKTIGGFNGYQVVSAMQKCIRRGLEQDALFWATELWASCNQTGREYIWHRLRVIASEDVGLADNNACVQVSALYATFQRRPNEKLFLWHAVLLLARAPKSRIVDHAGIAVSAGPRPKRQIPSFAIDNHAGGEMNWNKSFKLENCTL
jgi:MgsA AAA+ ATPase C terminal